MEVLQDQLSIFYLSLFVNTDKNNSVASHSIPASQSQGKLVQSAAFTPFTIVFLLILPLGVAKVTHFHILHSLKGFKYLKCLAFTDA